MLWNENSHIRERQTRFELARECLKRISILTIAVKFKRFYQHETYLISFICLPFSISFHYPVPSEGWFDETHVAIARVAGYSKWFNAVGPDMIKEKMGNREGHNHFVNNYRGMDVMPGMVLAQAEKYKQARPQWTSLWGHNRFG
jgi:hypothetical protein